MPQANNNDSVDWMPIIGRSLAYLCLHSGEQTSKSMVDQAEFLGRLGIPRREAAAMLGTSDESLRVMIRQREQKATKGKSGGK